MPRDFTLWGNYDNSPTNVTKKGPENTVTISFEALLAYNKFSCIFENIGGHDAPAPP